MTGKCIDSGDMTKQKQLFMYDCHCTTFGCDFSNQAFTMEKGFIQLGKTGLCLSLSGTGGEGSLVILWPCEGQSWQKWTLTEDKELIPLYNPYMCLDVQDANKNNLAGLILWTCWGGMNQKWYLEEIGKPIPNWKSCTNGINTCADNWNCCVGPKDCSTQETTCRPGGDECSSCTELTPNWETCTVGVDTCADNWYCCVAPADCSLQKTTCRPGGEWCSSCTDYLIPNWETCSIGVDTCVDEWYCCVAPADCSTQKTTCRPGGDECSSCTDLIPNWETCTIGFDTCADNWSCCVAPADCSTQKATCRPGGEWCSSCTDLIPNWRSCTIGVDRCADDWSCCVAPADCISQKTTCRPGGDECTSETCYPIPNWETCKIGVDVCADNWSCCVAPADCAIGKTTCRPGGYECSSCTGDSLDMSFSIISMPPYEGGKDGLTSTVISENIATMLVGGPGILFGAVTTNIMVEICYKIHYQGKTTISAEIKSEYMTGGVYPVFHFQSFGGCGSPFVPAFIQAKFVTSTGRIGVIICASDAKSTGLCPIWIYGSDIDLLWENVKKRRFLTKNNYGAEVISYFEVPVSPSHRQLRDCTLNYIGVAVGAVGTGISCGISLGWACPFSAINLGIGMTKAVLCATKKDGCFPGDAVVYKPTGTALISEVKVGDSLATTVNEKGEMQFEKVYFLSHDDDDAFSEFIQIKAVSLSEKTGAICVPTVVVVEMTALHYIPVLTFSSQWVNTKAQDVSIGDVVLASSKGCQHHLGMILHVVSSITVVKKKGLFSPYTTSGMILVNNVSVSSHSSASVFDFAYEGLSLASWVPCVNQFLLTPLRFLMDLLGVDLYMKAHIPSGIAWFILLFNQHHCRTVHKTDNTHVSDTMYLFRDSQDMLF